MLFALFGSVSDCVDAFKGIRKFLGVGGGGTHVSVADAIIGTTGIPYTGCKLFVVMATALTGFAAALESSHCEDGMKTCQIITFCCIRAFALDAK